MNNRDRQAQHFDSHQPFVPAKAQLRRRGFSAAYILKDLAIGDALRTAGLSAQDRVLDIGCGDGLLLDRLNRSFGSMGFGADVSLSSLRRAKRQQLTRWRSTMADAYHLPHPDGCFDAVVSLDVLEHIEAPAVVVNEIARVLRPNGRVICYVVGSRNQYTWNWLWIGVLDRLGMDPWGRSSHRPELLVDPQELQRAFARSGLAVVGLVPFHSFATIGYDQLVLGTAWLLDRLLPDAVKRGITDWLGAWWLNAADRVNRVVYRFLQWLDKPWTARGLSNGFLLIAEKPVEASIVWEQSPLARMRAAQIEASA